MSRWVEFIFLCLRIEFVHCVYQECASRLAVLAPCSARRAWCETEGDTAPKKARAHTRKCCIARLREERLSFRCKDSCFIFYCKVIVFFLFWVFRSGKIP